MQLARGSQKALRVGLVLSVCIYAIPPVGGSNVLEERYC